jgi:hypothetical protein
MHAYKALRKNIFHLNYFENLITLNFYFENALKCICRHLCEL